MNKIRSTDTQRVLTIREPSKVDRKTRHFEIIMHRYKYKELSVQLRDTILRWILISAVGWKKSHRSVYIDFHFSFKAG